MTGARPRAPVILDLMPGACLAELAGKRPDDPAILFVDGPEWTFGELRRRVLEHAAALQALGLGEEDRLASWLPNGPLAVLNLLACAELRAVFVPINTAYRGAVLEHVLRKTSARLMIAHGELVERLEGLDLGRLGTLVIDGDQRPAFNSSTLGRTVGREALAPKRPSPEPPSRSPAPWDVQMIVWTSGTTGPSKGVLSSYRHTTRGALGFAHVGPGDRTLTSLPMFHVGGVYGVLWTLYHGGSTVLTSGFSTSQFWPLVKRYGIDTTGLLGAMVDFLNAMPPFEDERDHGLKNVLIAPYGRPAMRFAERYGVDVYTLFNMSELSVPLFSAANPGVAGTCGMPTDGIELRIADEHDIEVSPGETGELLVRAADPWQVSHGYLDDAEATARTWRNGWFHTGDLFRRDDTGQYVFVDRSKDAIRRRGENISSFEVESALVQVPGVVEAVAIAVPAPEASEDEVMAVLRMADGIEPDWVETVDLLQPLLASYMVPRFFRTVSEFPRTPTQKIEKHRLRAEGITGDTWDREAAGIRMRRERLGCAG